MGYAFISYCTKNQESAEAMRQILINNNIDTWMAPYNIPAGSDYAAVITNAIRECSCFVLLLSEASQGSVAVNSEVELGVLTFKKPIVIVELEQVTLNDAFTFYIHNKQIFPVRVMDEKADSVKEIVKSVRLSIEHGSIPVTSRNDNNKLPSGVVSNKKIGEIKEFSYDDGVYVGEAIGNLPHGFGTRYYKNGNKYEGQWDVGSMHGEGTFYYVGKGDWIGEWQNNSPWNGKGTYIFNSNGVTVRYEGEISDGGLKGYCKIYHDDVLKSKGEFLNGKLNGYGELVYRNKKCVGDFKNGRPWNAEGKYILNLPYKRPAEYDGYWQNGVPHGKGLVTFLDKNDKIEGLFLNGLNGTVKWYFADGRHYEGEISDARLSGKGTMFDKEGGVIYKGEYANSNPNGKGVRFYKGFGRYEGEMKDGKCHGEGTFYSDKGNWTGEWKEGSRWNGRGINFFYDDDNKLNGKIMFGATANGKVDGHVVIIYPDGSRYEGHSVNGIREGVGTYTASYGVWTGEWKNDVTWSGQGVIKLYDDAGNPDGYIYNGSLREGKANGFGVHYAPDGSRFEGEFFEHKYYNGRVIDANNRVIDTYVAGESQNVKRNQRNVEIASVASEILKWL